VSAASSGPKQSEMANHRYIEATGWTYHIDMRAAVAAIVLVAWPLFAQLPDPAREAERAQALVAAGKLDEAIPIYRDLVRRSPTNPVLLLNLGIAEYTAKHYREAGATTAAALKLDPDLLPARLFLGASQLELGELPAAIESLRIVVASNPRERNARLMLGLALLQSGQSAAAVEHLEAAAEMLPSSTRAWYALGKAREALGQSATARDAWARLMALPPSFESHLHAAEVHNAEQRWRDAAAEYREAVRVAPEKPAIRVALAQALFRSREYPAVMDTLKPLLAGDSADVQFLYGASLLNLQQPLEAIPYLRQAIARNALLLPARAALGQALLQTGKPAEAIPFLEAATSVDQDGSTRFQLFRAYQLTRRDSDAQRALADYQRFRASLAPRP
jgi:tetratricopeptide (TPR) repeat protein